LEERIAVDAESPATQALPLWRMRVGLYTYQEAVASAPAAAPPEPDPAPTPARRPARQRKA
jgi:hypothetical protein